MTREIDNFFPGMFDYFNVRVYDDEKTNLLKHWDNTFKYISRARNEGSKVLVHCKMGVSRSASVVIAYAMKAYNLNFSQAMKHVKKKRNCIKPNKSFLVQLETYQGMLDAMKNKEKLQRSKSETNLRSVKDARLLPGSEPTPLIQALNAAEKLQINTLEKELKKFKRRPKSWSPDHVEATVLLPKQQSQSLENLTPERKEEKTKNVLLPCSNGQNYSVSQNQVVHLQQENYSATVPSVKDIVSELESNKAKENKKQNTNIYNNNYNDSRSTARKETWDPGEPLKRLTDLVSKRQSLVKNSNLLCDSLEWTSPAQIIHKSPITNRCINDSRNSFQAPTNQTNLHPGPKDGDLFSVQLDQVFDHEEKKENTNSYKDIMLQPISSAGSMFIDQQECLISQHQHLQQQKQAQHPAVPISSQPSFVSRQSSFSSVDSAVVLGYPGDTREMPSRHSSWGSGDNRILPSRNSSWGSYDIKQSNSSSNTLFSIPSAKCNVEQIILGQSGIFPYEREEIPWHPGTVKRTKQKLENTSIVKRLCGGDNNTYTVNAIDIVLAPEHANNKQILNRNNQKCKYRCNSEETLSIDNGARPSMLLSLNNRLSASAPETSTMGCISKHSSKPKDVNNVAHFCVNKSTKKSLPSDVHTDNPCQNIYGIVQNLKMSFEAKEDNAKKVKSLPSSPVAMHPEKGAEQPFNEHVRYNKVEEINVKDLVDRYEVTKTKQLHTIPTIQSSITSAIKQRPRSVFETRQHITNLSKPLMLTHSTIIPKIDECRRPPVPPTVKNTLGNIHFLTTNTHISANSTNNTIITDNANNSVANNSATGPSKNITKRIQQHGKTHPLSRLGLSKQRLNTATYNTM